MQNVTRACSPEHKEIAQQMTIFLFPAPLAMVIKHKLRWHGHVLHSSGPEVIKLFSCSTQLSMKFSPLINVKMPTIVGILTCISGKNNILGLTEPLKGIIS